VPGFFVFAARIFRLTKFFRRQGFMDSMPGDGPGELAAASGRSIAALDRRCFRNSNCDCAAALNSAEGLPSFDEQKKTRLRSHLSA
jgi:hypothetical protein